MSNEKKSKEDFYAVLGMDGPSDVCTPDLCEYSEKTRLRRKRCTEGHPTGGKRRCEWHSNPQYR
jgi:hypothetical protein